MVRVNRILLFDKAQGEDIRIISELLGHKDIRVSLIYSKVDSTRLKGAVDRLGYNLVTSVAPLDKNVEDRKNLRHIGKMDISS